MKKHLRFSFWQLLFYLSLLVISIWVILKSFGIIKTPFWLEYRVPILGFVIGFLAFYQGITNNIKDMAVGLASLNVNVSHLDRDVEHINADLKFMRDDFRAVKNNI